MPGDYYIEEQEQGWGPKDPRDFFLKYGWLVIAAFIWLMFRHTQPIKTFGLYDAFFIGLALLIPLSKMGKATLQWLTPKLISDPIHTSTCGYGFEYGIYTCFTTGDIDCWVFKEHGRDGTIVAPTMAVTARGRNIDIGVPLERIPPSELPYAHREAILRNKLLRPPYWRGYIPKEILVKNPELEYLPKENKQLSRTNAFYLRLLEEKGLAVEEIMKRKSRFQQLKESVVRKKEEEY